VCLIVLSDKKMNLNDLFAGIIVGNYIYIIFCCLFIYFMIAGTYYLITGIKLNKELDGEYKNKKDYEEWKKWNIYKSNI